MIIRVCLVAVLLTPAVATAQGNPGPYGGLFGRAPASTGGNKTIVEVRSGIGGQYDTAVLPPNDGPLTGSTKGAPSSGVVAGIVFDHTSTDFNASLRGGVSRSQYFTEPTYGLNRFSSSAQIGGKLGTRFELGAAADYLRSPFFEFFQDFGRGPIVIDETALPFSPYAAKMLDSETLNASAGIKTRISSRSSVDLSVSRRQTLFSEQPQDDLVLNGYRATWTVGLTRDLGVHAGYGREQVDHRGDSVDDYQHEIIDLGVDYSRQFSIARRTNLAVSTSTSIIKDSSSDSRFRLNGSISLSKYFRRTWRAAAQVTRETAFVPGFSEPLFSDTAGVSIAGMFTKRIEWIALVTGGKGENAFSRTSGFNTVAASSRLSIALNNRVSAYGQYVRYWYEVPTQSLTIEVPGRMDRQVFAVGLGIYLPVYQKMRQAGDTR